MKPPEQTRLVVFDTMFLYIIKNRVGKAKVHAEELGRESLL